MTMVQAASEVVSRLQSADGESWREVAREEDNEPLYAYWHICGCLGGSGASLGPFFPRIKEDEPKASPTLGT
jgi:hypothetical protein